MNMCHFCVTHAHLTPSQVNAAGLLELCEQMSAVVVDKVALRYIDKLRMALRRINPSHEGGWCATGSV